jgi:hypothetical protein
MLENLRTVTQLVQENPALTVGGVRWDIFNMRTNGLEKSGAVIKKGRRIYIDPTIYYTWLRGVDNA